MAGPSVKEILLKWGVDNTNWKSAIKELATLLESENRKATAAQEKASAALDKQKAKLKDYIASQKTETAEIEKQIDKLKQKAAAASATKAEASAKLAVEKALTAENDKQVAVQRQLQAIQKTLQAEVNTKLMQEKLVTAEYNKQTAAIRQQAAAHRLALQQQGRPPRGPGGTGGRGGGGGGGVGGFLSGMLGGGIFGNITAAVASAEALGAAVKRLAGYIGDLAKEVGPLQQVKEQFEKLAPARGINDPVAFINQLRGATRGLVADVQLYRNANVFLQSSVNATSSQVVQLTQATVGLARAQGRDAGAAVQALNRFFLTGRAFTLAYATGIQRVNLQVGGLGRGTDATITSQKQFQQALAAITEQYKMIGEPAETYSEALTRLGTAVHNVILQFALGATQSAGFQNLIKMIDQLSDSIQSMAAMANKAGEFLGNILAPVDVEVALAAWEAVKDVLTGVWEIVQEIGKGIKAFVEIFSTTAAGDLEGRLTSLTGIFTTIGETIVIVTAGARELLNVLMLIAHLSMANSFKELSKALDDFRAKEEQISNQATQHLNRLEQVRTGQTGGEEDYRIKFAAPAQIFTAEQEAEAARKVAKVKEEIAIQSAKIQLEATKMRIQNEEELVQSQYDQGLMAFQEYLQKKANLNEQDHQATLTQLKQEFEAKQQFNEVESRETREMAAAKKAQVLEQAALQKADIEKQREERTQRIQDAVTAGKLTPTAGQGKLNELNKQYDALKQLIDRSQAAGLRAAGAETAEADAQRLLTYKQYLADKAKADNEAAQKGRQLTEQEIQQEVQARQKLVEMEAKIAQDGLDRQKELLESSLKEGMVTSEQYFHERVGLINEEYDVAQTAASKKLEQNKNSLTAQAEFETQMANAEGKRQKELTQLADNEWTIRTQSAQKAAERMSQILEGQLKYQETLSKFDPLADRSEQIDTLQKIIKLEETRLKVQQAQVKAMEEAGLRGTDTWAKEASAIATTQEKILQLNDQLAETNNYTSAIAGAAKTIGTSASFFPRGGEHTARGMDKFASMIETINQQQRAYEQQVLARRTGATAPKKISTPEEAFEALAKEGEKTGDILISAVTKADKAMEGWAETSKETQAELSKALDSLNEQIKSQTDSMGKLLSSTNAVTEAMNNLAGAAVRAAGGKGEGFFSGATLKHFQTGGPVSTTGPAFLHSGEFVFPSMQALSDLLTRLDSVLGKMVTGVASITGMPVAGAVTSTGLSGPASAANPLGTITDSDMTSLTASVSSGSDPMSGLFGLPGLGGAAANATKQITALGNSAQNASGTGGKTGGISSFMDNLQQNFQKLFSGDAGDMGKGASGLLGQVAPVASSVGGLISAAKGTGGPFQAGMGGLASGMQLGGMFGPLGMAIGGGAGLITGIFSGKAEEQAQKLAQKIVAMFNAVQTEIQNGTQTLAQGVQQQIANIETAVSSLSGKKGGRQQLENILPQMEQQLSQLQAQQQQTIKSMDSNLDVLNAPQAYQDTLTQVQQIIQTYQQYIQAGGNVANANEFLRQSFVNLVQNGMNELNSDEQDAINNALSYNDLLLQRQNLISNTNQQIQNIMSQGVAVRQMPEGVSKAQQIEQVEQGAQEQLDQMNEEISVAGYKLTVEQKIFNLATTRIGLENQLVVLQNQQTNLQMQQISALGSAVSSYQQQIPENMQSALSQLGLGASYVSPGTEPGLMPVPPAKTGIPAIDLQNQLQYQQQLQYYQSQLNQPTGFVPTTGALPGTTVVPTDIGSFNPTTTMPANSTWLQPGQNPISTASPAALQEALANAGVVSQQNATFLGTTPGPLGSSTLMPGQPGTNPITVNGQLVDTISTANGQALLVTMATTTGPGTMQTTGLVGTVQSVAAASTNTFNQLSGAAPALLNNPIISNVQGAVSNMAGKKSSQRGQLPPMKTGAPGVVEGGVVTTTAPTTTTGPMAQLMSQLTPAAQAAVQANPAIAFLGSSMLNKLFPGGTATGVSAAPGTATVGTLPPSNLGGTTVSWPSTGTLPPMTPGGPVPSTSDVTSQLKLQAEQQISQLSAQRVSSETQLVSLKMQEIAADMTRVQAHQALLAQYQQASNSSSPLTLESLMQSTYETRGRQGFGKFYGEIANPT